MGTSETVAEDNSLPESASAFVRGSICSVEQLAILLLLRANPFRNWTAPEVSRELRGNEQSAELHLFELCAQQLLENRGTAAAPAYLYAPSSDALRATLDAVAQAYAERPYAVIALIYSGPSEFERR